MELLASPIWIPSPPFSAWIRKRFWARTPAPALAATIVLPVGSPFGRREVAVLVLGHLAKALVLVVLIELQHPQVFRAATIRDEEHLGTVGAIARHAVEAHPLGDSHRFSAGHRNGVEVTEQVEEHRRPVGADVQRQPGALRRGECHSACRLERQVLLVPVVLRLFLVIVAFLVFLAEYQVPVRVAGHGVDGDTVQPGRQDSPIRGALLRRR